GEVENVRKETIAGGIIEATDEIADDLVSRSEGHEDILRVVRKVAAKPPLTKRSTGGLTVEAPSAAGLEKDGFDRFAGPARIWSLPQPYDGHVIRQARYVGRRSHLCSSRITGRQIDTLCGAVWYAIYQTDKRRAEIG